MAKGDHDAAMNAINQNRNTMQTSFGNNANQFQNQYANAGNFTSGLNTGIAGAIGNNMAAAGNYNPNYSFTGQFNRPPQVQGSGNTAPGYSTNTAGVAPMNAGVSGGFDYSAYDPELAQVFQKAGITPTGRGTGPTDIAQWQDYISKPGADKQYYLGRLGDDLAGHGMDSGMGGGFSPIAQMDTSFISNWQPQSRSYYQNFADTGGLSTADQQNLRARGVAPTRSIYQSAQDDMARRLALSGGASGVNANAASIDLARKMSNDIFNQDTATNAGIAQMVQQGKQFGTSGLGGLDTTQLQALTGANEANLGAAMQSAGIQSQQEIAGNQQKLAALGLGQGATGLGINLLGTTPGQLQLAQSGILNNQGQQANYGLGSINSQIGASGIPGNFQSAMGNIGSILGLGGNIAGGIAGLFPTSYGGGGFSSPGQPLVNSGYNSGFTGGFTGW